EDGGKVKFAVLPMLDILADLEAINLTDHLVDRVEAKFRHEFSQVLGDEFEEVDHVVRVAGEAFAEFGVLRGDAYGAGVQMAFAHHDTAFDDEGCGSETPFFRTQQGGDGDVAAGFHLAVGLEDDAATKLVLYQGLVGFGEAEFPGQTGVTDRAERRCACSAVVAGDEDDVRFRFGYAGGDRTYTGFGHQLDADAGGAVGILEVEDQLCEVFDGIDVVVRGRGDEAYAGGGVADLTDPFVHFVAGKLAAFTGFGSLRHFDLEFVRHGEVVAGHAETGGGYLLDGGAHRVAVRQGLVAQFVF